MSRDTIEVPLHRRDRTVRAVAIIDAADADRVLAHSWRFGQKTGYPQSKINGRQVLMHRFILELAPGDGLAVDHVNMDKLDNRRENLRIATVAENAQNRIRRRGKKHSQYRGVGRTVTGRWRASATLNGKLVFLGEHDDEIEAALAASEWRREHMPFSPDARGEYLIPAEGTV